RARGKVVYLEAESGYSKSLMAEICEATEYALDDVLKIEGKLDLKYVFELAAYINMPEIRYPTYKPKQMKYENIFEKIKSGDFLLQLPYESFQPTTDFLAQASKDPSVLAIKITLYRADEDSRIIKALKDAARNKKQVTVLVELKARFDEEKNIIWARELEYSGCHVIYGIPGMKIHSKIAMVVRNEGGRICRYLHLSTGNYNEKTALIYTDTGFFTCNDDFGSDISDVFNVITGYSLPSRWKRIVSAPNDLREYCFELIEKEMECQKKYKNGLIIAKMNSLEDPKIIEKPYEASCAEVKIKLIVRGICCLVPGVKGLSENIEIRSIVGRYLEHSRVFLFNNNNDKRIFLSSADWMRRNLDKRIEVLFEVTKGELKENLAALLDINLNDSLKARLLTSDKTYFRPVRIFGSTNAQEVLERTYGNSK
ncbi:MAG: polyphosphate kinase 1, partial [Candidatus Firestonebacteria bacterium]